MNISTEPMRFDRASRRRIPRAAASFLAALAAAALAAPAAWRTCCADGLHCAIFSGGSVLDSWRAFVAQAARQTRPHDPPPDISRESLGKKPDPMWRSPAAARMAAQAVAEIILILEYVDPYNYAPDSPKWMERQETREDALADARAILREIGRPAAFPLWEALAFEIRVKDDPAMAPYREFRKKQLELYAIKVRRQTAAEADDRVRAAREEIRRLRERLDTAWAPFNDIVRQINDIHREMGAPNTDEKRRAFLRTELRRLEAEKEKLVREAQNETDRVQRDISATEEALRRRENEILAAGRINFQEDLRRAAELEAALAKEAGRAAVLVRRGDLFALDPMMCPRPEFAETLRECLTDLGVEALLAIEFGRKSPGRAAADEAERLRNRLKQDRFLPALVAALGDDEAPMREAAAQILLETALAAAPALIEGLKSERRAVRDGSLAVLRRISRSDFGEDASAWLKWLEGKKNEMAAAKHSRRKTPRTGADDGRPDPEGKKKAEDEIGGEDREEAAKEAEGEGRAEPDGRSAKRPPGKVVEDTDEAGERGDALPKPQPSRIREGANRLPPGADEKEPEKLPELEIAKPEKRGGTK